jgi:hypothetical protein
LIDRPPIDQFYNIERSFLCAEKCWRAWSRLIPIRTLFEVKIGVAS